jgi:hypothetical protein
MTGMDTWHITLVDEVKKALDDLFVQSTVIHAQALGSLWLDNQ